MSRGRSTTAVIEVDFLADERVVGLSSPAKLLYFAYWLTAVRERREVLPMRIGSPSNVARRHFLGIRAAPVLSERLHACGLLARGTVNGEEYIIVKGARQLHAHLRHWHDEEDAQLCAQLRSVNPSINVSSCRVVSGRVVSYRDGSVPTTGNGSDSDPFENFITGQFKMTLGTDPTPMQMKLLLDYVREFGQDRKKWTEAFEALGARGTTDLRYLRGCLRRHGRDVGVVSPEDIEIGD